MSNCSIKDSVFHLFSSNLEELVLKKTLTHTSSLKMDMLRKVIHDGTNFRNLKLLSLHGYVSEEALLALISSNIFP